MNYDEIRRMPIDIQHATGGWHESVCRAYHIVEKVKELLDAGTEPSIVRDLIRMMETPLPESTTAE